MMEAGPGSAPRSAGCPLRLASNGSRRVRPRDLRPVKPDIHLRDTEVCLCGVETPNPVLAGAALLIAPSARENAAGLHLVAGGARARTANAELSRCEVSFGQNH